MNVPARSRAGLLATLVASFGAASAQAGDI